jgi:parallel beta-helix repeat protein
MNLSPIPRKNRFTRPPAISRFFGLALLLGAVGGAHGTEFYVATDGNDASMGASVNSPLATLTKAISKAAPGDVIYIRGGTYREEVTALQGGGTAEAPVTITAYPNETPVIKASDLVTGWERHDGNIWKRIGWSINSQQVFRDGQPLQQIGGVRPGYLQQVYTPVGSGVADMYPGTFHYEWDTGTLYAWLPDNSDPNAAVIEASTKAWALMLNVPFVHVEGLTFRHCNYTQWYFSPSQAAVVNLGSDSIIEQCDIQWGDFGGLLMQSRSQALNCTISNNGAVGVGCVRVNQQSVFDIKIKGCLIENNNYRGISQTFHAGGIKLIPDINGVIEDNDVSNNNGPGIWIDWDRSGRPIVINNNHVRNNARVGIHVEGSENTLIYNNLVMNTRGIGIYISGSNNTRCYNNTIVGSNGYAAILMGGVPRLDCTLKNNSVYNNILFGSTGSVDLYIPQENGIDVVGNSIDYNCFSHDGGTVAMNCGGQLCTSLASWRALTGYDLNSINENPQFNLADTDDFSTSPMSPVVDSGMNLPEVTFDIRGLPRPQGSGCDMGAFETSWRDLLPPSAPANLVSTKIDWNHFRVAWSPSTDNVGVVGYDVYLDGQYLRTTTTPEITLDPLTPLRTYTIFVIAVDGAGLKSPMSGMLQLSLGAQPDAIAPTTPKKPKVSVKSYSELQLSWNPASDNVGVRQYCVFRNGVRVGYTAAVWYTDNGLTPATSYEYQISALDAAGNESPLSKIIQVKTLKKFARSEHESDEKKAEDKEDDDKSKPGVGSRD